MDLRLTLPPKGGTTSCRNTTWTTLVKICGEAARFAKAFVTGSYFAHTAPRAEQLLKSPGRRRAWKGAEEAWL